MPYCPKCDMEFVDGITTCTDCGGPLVESKEVADAMKKKQQEEEYARQRAQFEAMQAAMAQQAAAAAARGEDPDVPRRRVVRNEPDHVYIKKSQKYDDLKSSASAFLLVGGVLTAACVLCWTGIISLPLAGLGKYLMQGVLTVMGIGFLIIGLKSMSAAKSVSGEVKQEEQATRDLVNWFTSTYTAQQIDRQIMHDYGDMDPEELSLKRFYLIHDLIIVNQDLHNESYLDLLCEEIYSKMFED